MLKENTFETGSVRLDYADGGGPHLPLLMLHGATLNWQTFLPLIPALTESWRVLALDLRGHGKSDWVPGGYRFVDYAPDVKSFLRSVAVKPTVIVAHSFAGLFAIQTAAEAPDLVRALVLEDPPLFYRRKPLRDTTWYDWFAKVYAAISGGRTKAEIEVALKSGFPNDSPALLSERAERLTRVDPDALLTFMEHRHMEGYDLDGFLQRIACPVLLVQTDPALGTALEDEDAAHAMSLLRRGQLARIEGAGHMMHSSRPGLLLQQMARFLDGER